MPEETVVDQLYQSFEELIAGISGLDLSLQITARITFSKSLLMAVAGYFEEQVQRQVVGFIDDCTAGNELTRELVIRRAFGRQYHNLLVGTPPMPIPSLGILATGFTSP